MTNLTSRLIAAVLLTASFAAAEDTGNASSIKWKKVQLTDKFYSEGAAFSDFNHDGKMDVVAGPYWYEGPDFSPEKKHAYMPEQVFDPSGYSKNFFAFTYDFNHDGWDDILILGFPGEDASWYENPKGKDGNWTRHKVFDVVDNESPTFGDLLGDGKPVLICMSGGQLGYAAPDWTDASKPWAWHPATAKKGEYQRFTHGMGWGDVNGDGKNDLLVAEGWYEQPQKLEGDPQWKFHPYRFADGGSQMYVYDINGDGKPDVITSLQAHGYGLVWYENQGQDDKGEIRFEKHVIMGAKEDDSPHHVKFSQLHAVDLIDINGDGLKDIVTGKRYWAHGAHGDQEPGAPAVLYWFELVRKDGKADFVPHQIDDNSGVGTQVMAQDINHDKHPAIVVGNKKGTFVFTQEK